MEERGCKGIKEGIKTYPLVSRTLRRGDGGRSMFLGWKEWENPPPLPTPPNCVPSERVYIFCWKCEESQGGEGVKYNFAERIIHSRKSTRIRYAGVPSANK